MTDMPDWDDDILGEDTTDDVIELTDIADVSSGKSEEGIIELTDIVEDDLGAASQDAVIELTDIVEDNLDVASADPVIELTDIAEDEESDLDTDLDEIDGEGFGLDDDFSMDDDFAEEQETDMEVIGLPEDDPEEEQEDQEEQIDEPVEEYPVDDISIGEPVDEILPIEVPVAGISAATETKISADDIEAALDRVIEKKFAGRIETMLFEVMEKVIEKEIKQIKATLQKDLDPTENG